MLCKSVWHYSVAFSHELIHQSMLYGCTIPSCTTMCSWCFWPIACSNVPSISELLCSLQHTSWVRNDRCHGSTTFVVLTQFQDYPPCSCFPGDASTCSSATTSHGSRSLCKHERHCSLRKVPMVRLSGGLLLILNTRSQKVLQSNQKLYYMYVCRLSLSYSDRCVYACVTATPTIPKTSWKSPDIIWSLGITLSCVLDVVRFQIPSPQAAV